MAGADKSLQVVLDSQTKRDMTPGITNIVVAEMKGSLLFQYNWEELLMSGPVAINCMGACFMASASHHGNEVTLHPPKDGFKYLKFDNLSASLVECGTKGRLAFLEAESGMGAIQQLSKMMYNKIGDIIQSLMDPVSAQKLLKPQMSALKTGADDCLDHATAIDKVFDDWLMYVCELHAGCVNESATTKDALASNAICLVAEQSRLDYQQAALADAKDATEKIGKTLDLASEAYKKASDSFPSGWDVLGQQVVGGLADCLTTCLNAAVPALINNLGPMAEARIGSQIVGGFVQPPKDKADPTTNGDNTATPAAPPPSVNPQDFVPKASDDPAYSAVLKDLVYLDTLHVILTGASDGGVDWEKAQGDDTSSDAKSTIGYVQKMLSDAKDSFATLASNQEPSKTFTKVLEVTENIASDVVAELAKGKDASNQLKGKDSPEVQKWQSDFGLQYASAVKLSAVAKTLPGSASNGIPLMSDADANLKAAQVNAKTAQAQATFQAAQTRLNTTQAAFLSTQQTYQKSTELLVQQEQKMGDIKATLTKLTASNLTLSEIKDILFECIKLVITLKTQITNLVRFFKAIAAVVELAVTYHVEPFINTLKSLTAADGTDAEKEYKIGNFTLTDYQRSNVYNSTLTIRAYFGLFGDIASMWVKVSVDNIMPGLKLCDELSVGEDGTPNDLDAMKAKAAALESWSQDAQDRVKSIAKEQRASIETGMGDRVDEIAKITALLPAQPEPIKTAITDGTSEVATAAQTALVKKATESPLSRFAALPDPDV